MSDALPITPPEIAKQSIEAAEAIAAHHRWEASCESQITPGKTGLLECTLKFSEVPLIETRFVVDPSHQPLCAGEAAQGPVAAAIGNAASKALGVRTRDLPLTRDRIVSLLMAN
jgi:nicotinate dehydrogenase subunit B